MEITGSYVFGGISNLHIVYSLEGVYGSHMVILHQNVYRVRHPANEDAMDIYLCCGIYNDLQW